jgi:hypothetical protein
MSRFKIKGTCAAALLLLIIAGSGAAHAQAPAAAMTASQKPALSFRGTQYLHRWSKNEQHEFTPAGQEDLAKWTDMVTLHTYSKVTDGEALAGVANTVLGNYQAAKAMVLKTDSIARTATRPAEHFIAVVFGRQNFLEVAFTRLRLVDGVGCSAVYSHRIHGEKVGPKMQEWLQKNAPDVEKALMEWNGMPSPATLSAQAL